MNTRFVVLLFFTALLVPPLHAAAGQRTDTQEQQRIIRLEQEWDDAFHRNDVRFIETVLADEFVATYSDGSRGDRAKELELAGEFNDRFQSSRLDDFTVNVYGDTAVVWFTQHQVFRGDQGPLPITLRYIDVFVRRGGRWQCVATQSTRVLE